MMEAEIRVRLEAKFKGVASSVYERNTLTMLDFLIRALDKHKIDVSDYFLGGKEGSSFVVEVKGQKVLSLNTKNDKICDGKFTILHELGHIVQMNAGLLGSDNYHLFWNKKGVEFAISNIEISFFSPFEYNSLPWELDAHYFALNSPLCVRPSKMFGGAVQIVKKNFADFKKWPGYAEP